LKPTIQSKKILFSLPSFADDKVKITKERVWIHRNEVVDAIEMFEENKLKYYSYTYKVMTDDTWTPIIRFDNWEIGSHYDKYDENGSLVSQQPCQRRTLEEVAGLAKEFRRNLVTMDISKL
jgi:hypothetical protein